MHTDSAFSGEFPPKPLLEGGIENLAEPARNPDPAAALSFRYRFRDLAPSPQDIFDSLYDFIEAQTDSEMSRIGGHQTSTSDIS